MEQLEKPTAQQLTVNEVELSSGVKVVFSKISRQKSQELTVVMFKSTKLDKNGGIKNSDDPNTNIDLASQMQKYHTALIRYGVKLVGKPEDYFSDTITKRWLKDLRFDPSVEIALYDLEDEEDVNQLFVRYIAFQSEADWQLLSQNVLNIS